MSNGDLESRVSALEASVANLQASLDELITNLAENNTFFIQALGVLADSSNSETTKQDAVVAATDGICDNRPPGCRH
jgi:hypothetical protein